MLRLLVAQFKFTVRRSEAIAMVVEGTWLSVLVFITMFLLSYAHRSGHRIEYMDKETPN